MLIKAVLIALGLAVLLVAAMVMASLVLAGRTDDRMAAMGREEH